MEAEGLDNELKPFSATKDRENKLKLLQEEVDRAFKNRIAVDLKSVLKRDNLEQLPNEESNGVWVENSHLYPHLLRLAYQKIGLKGRKLQQAIEDTFEHETQHFIPIVGLPHIYTRFGVHFYKVASIPFISVCQAEIDCIGKITLADDLDVITNVKRLSPSDKADLYQLLNYAKKLR